MTRYDIFNRYAMLMLFALFLSFLSFLLIQSIPSVCAFGIAPSRVIVDFSPENAMQTQTIRILNSEAQDATVLLSFDGDLAEHASFSPYASDDPGNGSGQQLKEMTLKLNASQAETPLTYYLDLPSQLVPGERTLRVIAKKLPAGASEATANVLVSTQVIHEMKMRVPYPGVYAEASLFVLPAQPHMPIGFLMPVYNKGSKEFILNGDVTMHEAEYGPKGDVLLRQKGAVPISPKKITPKEGVRLETEFKPGLLAGIYLAKAKLIYAGKELLLEKPFQVGEPFINITGIRVGTFRLGTIAKFDIALQSNWNNPVENISAEILITDNISARVADISTDKTALTSRSKGTVSAYWDTKDMPTGTYSLNITMHDTASRSHTQSFRAVIGESSLKVYSEEKYAELLARQELYSNVYLVILEILVASAILAFLILLFMIRKRGHGSSKIKHDHSKHGRHSRK